MTLIPDRPELLIERVQVAEGITVSLRAAALTAACPACGTVSQRVQSRYTRRLHDLPASGRPVRLLLAVRRLFCAKSACAQRICAERFPALCRSHAQGTIRLQADLGQLGLALGGQAGARLGRARGLSGSRATILRLVRRHHLPDPPPARVVGLDDWAWTRRKRYGTLICDLEHGLPIDLLPDRSTPTVAAWFAAHPGIEVVSRAGSSEYAAAIKRGAPQARQVSDRWHLTKQRAEAAAVVRSECLAEARRAAQVPSPERAPRAAGGGQRPAKAPALQRRQDARRAARLARQAQIIARRQHGVRLVDIARQVGMAQRTVRAWLKAGRVPYARPRRPRAHRLDPSKPSLLERWPGGCRSGAQLERERRARGYAGSRRGVYRYLAPLGPATPPAGGGAAATPGRGAAPPPPACPTLSPQRAVWRFFRRPGDLEDDEREALTPLRPASPRAETASHLVGAFLHMVRERAGHQLDAWLKAAEESQLDAFASCAAGRCRDTDAVLAGLTLPWRNGPLEGQLNRLKLSKRRMDGRAGFDLLRLRLLHRDPQQRERLNAAQARGQRPTAARAAAPIGQAA
jgi:transposase